MRPSLVACRLPPKLVLLQRRRRQPGTAGWHRLGTVPEEDGPIAVMPACPGMVVAANSVGMTRTTARSQADVMPKHGLF